jgi:predicted CoA-binding protein
MSFENPSEQVIQQYLKEAKNIAVIGLSNKEDRTSYKIAEILQGHGYRIFPVNPVLADQTILGEPVYARLQDISEEIDIVDIFRRSEFLPDVAKDFFRNKCQSLLGTIGD